jgi:hypothetical protein
MNQHTNGQGGVTDPMDSIQSDNDVKRGRDAGGRFAPGNRFGLGSSFARRAGRLRQVIQDEVSDDDLRRVVRAMIDKAAEGDPVAARLVLAYAVGKPQPAPEPDRATADEAALLREQVLVGLDLARLLPPEKGPEVLTATLPGFAEAIEAGERRAAEGGPDEDDSEEDGPDGQEAEAAGDWERVASLLKGLPAETRREVVRGAGAGGPPADASGTACRPSKPPR